MGLLKVGSGGVPVGQYHTTFVGVEDAPPNGDYGPGLRWRWRITDGPFAGQHATRITGCTPTAKNAAGKMLSGLIGRGLAEGEEIDPAAYVLRRACIVEPEDDVLALIRLGIKLVAMTDNEKIPAR